MAPRIARNMNCRTKDLCERNAVSSSRRSTGFSIAKNMRSVKERSSRGERTLSFGRGGSCACAAVGVTGVGVAGADPLAISVPDLLDAHLLQNIVRVQIFVRPKPFRL